MRYTPRRTRRRLTWLVEFMRLWFSTDDLRHQARSSLDRLRGAHAKDWPLDYALALGDALPEDCEERRLLQEALSLPGKVEDSDRKAISKNAWYGWFDLGNLLSGQNRPKEAEAAYRKSIALDPKFAWPWNGLGYLLHNLNRPKKAESVYCKAIELDPENPYPLANLDRLLAIRDDTQWAANQGPQALDGVAAESRTMAEESLKDIRR